MMKAKEIRELSAAELETKIAELKKELRGVKDVGM